jgi:uncharacterized protein YbgA (DUF1722 family)/uncharacterized protein YbbK (DUF523 family)
MESQGGTANSTSSGKIAVAERSKRAERPIWLQGNPKSSAGLPIRIGVSSCLIGQPVRYNAQHARDLYVQETLGRYFEFVPVCPEVEMGLGVPRPTLQLRYNEEGLLRLVVTSTGEDHTQRMETWAKQRLRQLAELDLCGYILKKNSPSCGLRVRTFRADGKPAPSAPGMFAATLMEAMPLLPVIEEGRLHDPALRENWVERVFAYYRLKLLWTTRWNLGDLIAFHTAHKMQLMAHSPQRAEQMGRFVAQAKNLPRDELKSQYEKMFMETLAIPATRGRHANVLHHMLGYFSNQLDQESRQELLGTIQDFRRGVIPLVVPLVLVRHYVRVFQVKYLQDQIYLEPYPAELALRSFLI